jgi:hypothetical protein
MSAAFFLVAAQPTFFGEVAHALALSGASRASDQVVQDWAMLSSSIDPGMARAAEIMHEEAAEALRNAFRGSCAARSGGPRISTGVRQ